MAGLKRASSTLSEPIVNDIFLHTKEELHMAVIIGHASIDERGKANSGQAGDQTGRMPEIRDA